MEIIELKPDDHDRIEQVLEIYREAFPLEERDPEEHLLEMIRQGAETALPGADAPTLHCLAAVEGQRVAGMSILCYYPATQFGFITYLAVHADWRGSGVGAQLYQQMVTLAEQDGHGLARGIVFEVEPPEAGKDPAEQALRWRRISFYRRNGAEIVPHLQLVAPPLAPSLPEVVYTIMLHPFESCALPLSRAGLEAIVATVLGFGYGLAPDAPQYQRTLASIG